MRAEEDENRSDYFRPHLFIIEQFIPLLKFNYRDLADRSRAFKELDDELKCFIFF